MKIAVINDLHPDDSPGAASIALNLAVAMSLEGNNCEFWCSSENSSTSLDEFSSSINLRLYVPTKTTRSRFQKKINEFFEGQSVMWIFKNLKSFKPDLIWVHQVGNVFPRAMLIYSKIMKVRVYCTLHDFSLIVPRKLYPSDFDSYFHENGILDLGNFDPFEKGISRLYLKIRILLNRFLYNNFSNVICISEMQSVIYKHFGFYVSGVVSNGVQQCTLNHSPSPQRDERINLLFVGRSLGKGLHFAINLTKSQPKFHLYLAGGPELQEEALKSLDDRSFTYLGKLNSDDLRNVYHKVDYVLVLSECFDVYPGVLMEALSHGCRVLTSNSVGNSHLGIEAGLTTIIESEDKLLNFPFCQNDRNIRVELQSHQESSKNYSRLFDV
jgi:glycosyltransferase involved in cell wall biosynthesis